MKKILAILLAVAMVFSLAACGAKKTEETPAAETATTSESTTTETAPIQVNEAVEVASGRYVKGENGRYPVLQYAKGAEPSNLDCTAETNDDGAIVMIGSIYEQLVYADVNNNVHPELCESYEKSDDSKTYTYYLRKGVLFHDGSEMTADDVVASMNRWLDFASTVDTMVGGARFEKVDDYTVTITMENGTAYLNEMIACYAQHAIITTEECIAEAAASADGFLQTYIGTGPYKWGEWVSADHITLLANDDYAPYGTEGDFSGWGGHKTVWFDKVVISFISDESSISAGMLTDEYDLTGALSMDYYEEYNNNENFNIMATATNLHAMIFNKKQGWGANQKFRQAVQALVNCDDCLYAALGNEDYYDLYGSYMFKGTAWYTDRGSEAYNQANKEKALELFAEAGFTADDTFTILCSTGSDYLIYATVIQEEFREIGLNCDILTYEWGTFTQVRNNEPENYNAFMTGFSPKVLPNLNLFLSATWAGWCTDERIQNDLATIATATDFDAAVELWGDLQEYMLTESVPIVKFGCTNDFTVWRTDLTGVDYKEWAIWINAHPVE